MARTLTSLCLVAVLTLVLTACGGNTAPPEPSFTPTPTPSATPEPISVSMEFVLPRTSASLHPILSGDKVNLALSGLIWEGLFALDNTFTPQAVLCDRFETSEDGLTWNFYIKNGITFSDGSPLTAAEVAESLRLAKRSDSRFSGRLSEIKSVSVTDFGAVQVVLTTPNGALPSLLDIPIVKGESEEPLGTGPYVPESWGDSARLTARQDWWQGTALPIQSIPLRTLQEADDFIYAFDTGDISLVNTDLTGTNALGYSGDHEVWDYPTTDFLYIGFNTARGPCADASLRRALAFSFDRSSVATALYARHAEAAALPVQPASPLYNQTLADTLAYSPQTFSAILEEAGYQRDEAGQVLRGRNALSLTFVVNTDNSFRLSTAEYLAGELIKAGIAVDLKKLSWNDYQKALLSGSFDLYLGETILTADFDLGPLISPGGTLNFGAYQSVETESLLSAFRAASGGARTTAAAALYTKLAADMPIVPLGFKNGSVLTQWGMVSGLAPTRENPFQGFDNWQIKTR